MRSLVAVAGAWLVVLLYALVQTRVGAQFAEPLPGFADVVRHSGPLIAIWILATPAILWSADRFPLAGPRWPRRLALHSALATAFIIVTNVAIRVPSALVADGGSWHRLLVSTVRGLVAWFHFAFLTYFLIVALGQLRAWARERAANEAKAAGLRAELTESRLRALQMQLHPHFLYNALNAATSLVLTKRNDEAVEVLNGLADLLREALAAAPQLEVPLVEEMRFVERYLGVESVRFADRLAYECAVPPELHRALVPRFVLQPLVENAVRHGVAPVARPARVEVRAERVGERVRIRVLDDGAGLSDTPRARGLGTGTRNTSERLAHLYGPQQSFALRSREGGGVEAVLELPFHLTPAVASQGTAVAT